MSDTLLRLITPVVDLEWEYEDGVTICGESSNMESELDSCGNPWINVKMEWHNQDIALRASAEVVTYSLDNPREREDTPGVQGHESCDVG